MEGPAATTIQRFEYSEEPPKIPWTFPNQHSILMFTITPPRKHPLVDVRWWGFVVSGPESGPRNKITKQSQLGGKANSIRRLRR